MPLSSVYFNLCFLLCILFQLFSQVFSSLALSFLLQPPISPLLPRYFAIIFDFHVYFFRNVFVLTNTGDIMTFDFWESSPLPPGVDDDD